MILTVSMAHPRELISQAVVALLIAANTAAGSRVTGMRVDPHKKSGLPALSAYTLADPANSDASSEMEEAHELNLEIAGWADVNTINTLAEQVETAMRVDPYLGGLVSDMVFGGTVMEVVEIDGRSDPIVAIAVMTYSVKYHIALEAT